MAVLKMEAVTIAGKIEDFESVVSKYVIGQEIHLEDALSVLENGEKLTPFVEDNQNEVIEKLAKEIRDRIPMPLLETHQETQFSDAEMQSFLENFSEQMETIRHEQEDVKKKFSENQKIMEQFDLLENVDVDLTKLKSFEFIQYHFGRMPKSSYNTLMTFLGNLGAIFVKISEDKGDVWGFYFVPRAESERINAVFDSLNFDEIEIPDAAIGTPKDTQIFLKRQNQELEGKVSELESEMVLLCRENLQKLSDICSYVHKKQEFVDVKRQAAHGGEFFYLVGWMPKKQALALEKQAKQDSEVIFFVEEADNLSRTAKPPTKLRNFSLFRPYELFVNMYGLPNYNEIDPTPIVAISYILLYGIMFGDVGQSALFAILGFLVYKKTKMQLAAILSTVGVSGTVFGFIYGSVFGNETLLESVRLIAPMERIMFLLISAVALGVVIILFCMVLNLCNTFSQRQWGAFLFSPNGVSGLIFYASLLLTVLNMVLKLGLPGNLLGILMAVTFVLMYLQEPLGDLIEGKKVHLDGMFFVESFFEMFDVLLSFVTNTISFLRVGAFAIIHVGMMMVVSVLAGRAGGGAIIVQIFGNALVMVLEGLIVGIQVLRLEYYEMFSRYFKGEGKPFVNLEK